MRSVILFQPVLRYIVGHGNPQKAVILAEPGGSQNPVLKGFGADLRFKVLLDLFPRIHVANLASETEHNNSTGFPQPVDIAKSYSALYEWPTLLGQTASQSLACPLWNFSISQKPELQPSGNVFERPFLSMA